MIRKPRKQVLTVAITALRGAMALRLLLHASPRNFPVPSVWATLRAPLPSG